MTLKRRTLLTSLAGGAGLCLLPRALRAESGPRRAPLILATTEIFPLAYATNEEKAGFLVELVTEVARRNDLAMQIHFMPWARCLKEAREGKISGIFAAFRTEDREPYLAFGEEVLMTMAQNLFVTADSPLRYDGNIESIAGLRIGMLTKISYGAELDSKLRNGSFRNVFRTDTPENLVHALMGGRIDMMILQRMEGYGIAMSLGYDRKVRALEPPLEEVPAYFGFTKTRDMSATIAKFDAALREMRRDGTYERIAGAYVR